MNAFVLSLFAISASILSATSAQAFPTKGDMAKYNVSTGSGVNLETTFVVTDLNSSTNTMTYQVTVSYNGQVVQNQAQTGSISEYSQMAAVVTNCAAVGGTNERVTTAAGTFDTCHVVQNSSSGMMDMWIGNVAFGIVKSIADTASGKITMELAAQKMQ